MFQRTLIATAVAASLLGAGAIAHAVDLTPVPAANVKATGLTSPSVLSPELTQVIAAQGSHALEHPAGNIAYYGYVADGPLVPPVGVPLAAGVKAEASKTEPDKNTYLVLAGQHGADANYDYGTHFLYQGHEGNAGYLTRINLDADAAHRVTLLASTDKDGKALPTFDGSTWDPFAQRLLLTAEGGKNGGVWQATVDYPSTVIDISGALGRGGYEGIQADNHGNLWIVEDVGGKTGSVNNKARQPNSFVFRFMPADRTDLTKGGKLQVLQVLDASGKPIVFNAASADDDILSVNVRDLHTYAREFDTKWVTVHDTAIDGNAPFDANAAAKAKSGTAFKRPENGVFRPGSRFTEFYFTETGDTNALTQAGAEYGGFGGVFKLAQHSAAADRGKLSIVFRGDVKHTGLDNIAFLTRNQLLVVEDAGDTLHTQRNALDSGYVLDLRQDYGNAANVPVRFLAEGRDPSATIDSQLGGVGGIVFQNDGDNEITGIHVSDGDATVEGLLGRAIPRPFRDGWRVFYTQQHGDNVTWEILRTREVFREREDD